MRASCAPYGDPALSEPVRYVLDEAHVREQGVVLEHDVYVKVE